MYQTKWNKVIPSLLNKIIDARIVRAHGSHFDCSFSLDFAGGSALRFFNDDLIYRSATQFEIILNREKIYHPLHFDSTDVFIHALGKITKAVEYKTERRKNAREIHIYFDAHTKHYRLQQIIYQASRYAHVIDENIAAQITAYLQPRADKMMVRIYRKQSTNAQTQQKLNTIRNSIEQHREFINKIYPPNNTDNKKKKKKTKTNETGVTVFDLYPLQSKLLTVESVRNLGQTQQNNGANANTNANANAMNNNNARSTHHQMMAVDVDADVDADVDDEYADEYNQYEDYENEQEMVIRKKEKKTMVSLYPIRTSDNTNVSINHSNVRLTAHALRDHDMNYEMNDDNTGLQNFEIGSGYRPPLPPPQAQLSSSNIHSNDIKTNTSNTKHSTVVQEMKMNSRKENNVNENENENERTNADVNLCIDSGLANGEENANANTNNNKKNNNQIDNNTPKTNSSNAVIVSPKCEQNKNKNKKKARDWQKLYCDVVCTFTLWNTHTRTAKKVRT